jgi:beta-galactosidase/beta-glucuronidase
MQRAGAVAEPLFGLNFKSTLWDSCAWTLSRVFTWNSSTGSSGDYAMLVFDGVKMAADVFLNGQNIASIADQFLRVSVPVNNLQSSNTLTVIFPPSSDARNNPGRFMACRCASAVHDFCSPPHLIPLMLSIAQRGLGLGSLRRHVHLG